MGTITIKKICSTIQSILSAARAPLAVIPAAILVCSAIKRPGLSPIVTASNIIRRASSELDIPHLQNDKSEAMERIRVEEIFKAIKMDMKVQVGIPIGGVQFMGTGANAGGPVTVNGFNVNAAYGVGIGG